MHIFYIFFISFLLVFFSELGDKTQLIVLSFASKLKVSTVLIGVALGSIFSHGIAIIFGSFLGGFENTLFTNFLKIISYSIFILLGILSFFNFEKSSYNSNKILNKFKINYIFIIAFMIAFGEIGDKTFLSSIGLGINYPKYKLSLIFGATLGMIFSNVIAIYLGKFLSKKIPEKTISRFSGLLFILFGILGYISL